MIQHEMNREADERAKEEGDDYDPYAPTELEDEDIVEHYDNLLAMREKDRALLEED
jgi:protein-tyrosine-phosphatase